MVVDVVLKTRDVAVSHGLPDLVVAAAVDDDLPVVSVGLHHARPVADGDLAWLHSQRQLKRVAW